MPSWHQAAQLNMRAMRRWRDAPRHGSSYPRSNATSTSTTTPCSDSGDDNNNDDGIIIDDDNMQRLHDNLPLLLAVSRQKVQQQPVFVQSLQVIVVDDAVALDRVYLLPCRG